MSTPFRVAEKPVEVLGGRLKVRMPEGAKVEQRGHNIMAAPIPVEQETRVVVGTGDDKLVLMAFETFQKAGEDFRKLLEATVSDDGKPGHFKGKFEVLELKSPGARGLACFVITPDGLNFGGDAVPVKSAHLVLADQTVVALWVFVTPKAMKDRPACEKLAAEILAGAEPGGRNLDLSGGKRSVGGLEVTMPENWVLTVQPGPDFTVWHFGVLAPFGKPGHGLSLYRGGHPSWQHDQASMDGGEKPKVTEVAGTFLGGKTPWHNWSSGQGDDARVYGEAMAKDPAGGDFPMMYHVFLSAADEKGLAELRAVAEKIVVGKTQLEKRQGEQPGDR